MARNFEFEVVRYGGRDPSFGMEVWDIARCGESFMVRDGFHGFSLLLETFLFKMRLERISLIFVPVRRILSHIFAS